MHLGFNVSYSDVTVLSPVFRPMAHKVTCSRTTAKIGVKKLMIRAIKLLKIVINSAVNRLRFDLAREIVVLISGGVVIATFAYIINDFLNVQIQGLSHVMRERFAEPLAAALLMVCAFKGGAIIRAEWSNAETASRMANFLGERPEIVRSYKSLHALLVLIVLHGGGWWLVRRFFIQPSMDWILVTEALMLAMTVGSAFWYREKRGLAEHDTGGWLKKEAVGNKARLSSFVRWRLAQIIFRNRTARICFIVSIALYLLLIPLQAKGIPFFASVACCILASIVASAALFFQLSEDLNYAWAERTMGISHQDFCKGYQLISAILALEMIAFATLTFVVGTLSFSTASISIDQLITLAFINLATPLLAPMMMFQIDGRKPVVNLILLTIAALFIDTAIFANKASLLLIPILHCYAHGSQNGRFYRA